MSRPCIGLPSCPFMACGYAYGCTYVISTSPIYSTVGCLLPSGYIPTSTYEAMALIHVRSVVGGGGGGDGVCPLTTTHTLGGT